MLKNAIWLFGFAVVMLIAFVPSFTKMQDLKIKNNEYAAHVDMLTKRNAYLEREMKLLTTDPNYLEKIARERMGLIRSGEKVYRMVPQAAVAAPQQKSVVKKSAQP